MSASRLFLLGLLIVSSWLVVGCSTTDDGVTGSGGASADDGPGTCPIGAESCSCFPDDTCNPGLSCASHLCISLGAGGSGGDGTTGGGGVGGDAGMPDIPGAEPDVAMGGSGGGAGEIDGGGGTIGGGTGVDGSTDSAGGPATGPTPSGGTTSTGGSTATGGSTNSATGYCTGTPDCSDLPLSSKYCTDRPMCLWYKISSSFGSCNHPNNDCTKTAAGVQSDPSTCTKQLGCQWVAGDSCASGLTLCGASCVDLTLDVNHCGNCDKVCPTTNHATPVCENGACSSLCERAVNGGPGFGDCDGDPSNGCETDLCAAPLCGDCAPCSGAAGCFCFRGGGGGCSATRY